MLIISARARRVSPFLPTLAATALRMWKGLGQAAERWWERRAGRALKGFLLGKSCKQGIPLRWNPHLVYCLPVLFFSFLFFKISRVITSPHGTVVNPLVTHVAISKYPDVWQQGRKEKLAI